MISNTDQDIDVKSETDARETEPAAKHSGVQAHLRKINKAPGALRLKDKALLKGQRNKLPEERRLNQTQLSAYLVRINMI